MTYAAEVLADNPSLYWRLQESSGTTAADSSGNNRDGTYNGAVILAEPGLAGAGDKAVKFDGTNDDQCISSIDDLGNTTYSAFSLECIVKYDANAHGTLIGILDATYDHWIALYQSGFIGGNPTLFFDWGSLAGFEPSPGPINVPIDEATHLVITYDGSTNNIYMDGVLAASVPALNPGTSADFVGVPALLYVGGDLLGFDEGSFATIDEPAFYEHALSAERVFAHFSAIGGSVEPPEATLAQFIAEDGAKGSGPLALVPIRLSAVQAASSAHAFEDIIVLTAGNDTVVVLSASGEILAQYVLAPVDLGVPNTIEIGGVRQVGTDIIVSARY